jgi:hypothetical protein
MKNFKKPTIGDFMKNQGLVVDGEIIKTSEELKNLEIYKEQKAKKDLEEMIKDPNYVPGENGEEGKSYSNKPFERKTEIPLSNNDMDKFAEEYSLYNFIKKEDDIEYDVTKIFENEDLLPFEPKEKKEFTGFEKKSLQDVVKKYINGEEQFVGNKKLSEGQINEAIDEFKQNFPEDFAKMIHKKTMDCDFKWKKEVFKDKNLLVSYYPNPEKPIMKYILNLNDKNLEEKTPITKIFIDNSIKNEKNVFKDKNGTILIFCSKPVKKLKLKR